MLFTVGQRMQGGTARTRDVANLLAKPWLHLATGAANSVPDAVVPAGGAAVHTAASQLLKFIAEHWVVRLNVAGSWASQEPGVSHFVR